MLQPDKILKEYRITEKSTELQAHENKYTFEVYPHVDRNQVKQAVEQLFSVDVAKVNILRHPGKRVRSRVARGKYGKKPGLKKAVVTLKEGSAIEIV